MKRIYACAGLSLVVLAAGAAVAWGFLPAEGREQTQEAQSSEVLVKGPVVQRAQKDRVTVSWVTRRLNVTVQKQTGGESVAVDTPLYHQMELEGFKPGTRYEYDLGGYGPNGRGSFVTAHEDGAHFRFVAYGDTRSRHDVHQIAVNRILAEKPDFVLHTGDLVADGRQGSDWEKFFEIERDLLRNTAFFPSLGNHERNADPYFRFFSFPNGNGHRYSFDWGSAHFAVINTQDVGETENQRKAFVQEQLEWLKEDLWRSHKPLKFVMFHQPLYSAMERRAAGAKKLAERYSPILEGAAVTAVFNGHDHNYQHHLKGGVHHIVTGGAGAPLYDVTPVEGLTLKAIKSENYVRVRVQGSKASFEAVDLAGKILDAFELTGGRMATAAINQ